jgi:hypothetical protein
MTTTPRARLRALAEDRVALLALVAALSYLALSAAWPASFWSSDSALKMLQVDALKHGRSTIPYLGQALDPTGRWAPLFPAFFDARPDGLRLVWPLGFAALSLPFYAALGQTGLYVVPALAGAATVYASGRLAERLHARAGAPAAAVVALASPVFIYSVSFWEHAVAACLTTWGVLLLVRERALLGGALLAVAAAGFRADVYPLIAAVGAATLLFARARVVRLALGGVLGSLPLWGMNVWLTGHAIPLNAAKNFSTISWSYLRDAGPSALSTFLLSPVVPWESAVAVPVAVALLFVLAARRASVVLVPLALAVAVMAALSLPRSLAELWAAPTYHGLLQACPFALFAAALRPRESASPTAARLLKGTVALHGLAYFVSISLTSQLGPAGGFVEWGPRFFLPFFPLVVPLAVGAVLQASSATAATAAALLVAVALVFELAGYVGLRAFTQRKADLGRIYAEAPGPLVSDAWWLPTLVPLTVTQKPTFWITRYDDFAALITDLRRSPAAPPALTLASFYDAPHHPFLLHAEVEGLGVRVLSERRNELGPGAIGLALGALRPSMESVTFGEGFRAEEHNGERSWRWMGARGELVVALPATEVRELRFTGYVMAEVLSEHPTLVTRIDGREVDSFEPGLGRFLRRIPAPPGGFSGPSVRVVFEASRTRTPPGSVEACGMALTGLRVD